MTATQPSWTVSSLRWVRCWDDCGQFYHPAYLDCDTCRGHGYVIGGDAQQACPGCSLRFRAFQRTYEKVKS